MKGPGYLKFLKLFLIGFGISFSMGLGVNSVSASSHHQLVGFDSESSVVDSNFEITALRGGAGLTNKLGLSKSLFAFRENRLFWWDSNGKPYFYIGNNTQGNAQRYALCDYFTMTGVISNCSYYTITGDYHTIFQNFFNNINAGDVFFYNVDSSSSSTTTMQLCWSSQNLNKSMCFNYSNGLTGSMGYSGLNFSNIPTSLLGYAPGQGQYNPSGGGSNIIGGSQVIDHGSAITGDTVSVNCTKNLALQWYRCNGYKTRMCYSSYGNTSDLYTGPGDADGYYLTGVDIEDVWFNTAWYRRNGSTGDSMGYSQWFSYWRKTYNVYKHNPQITNPFLGVPVSIFTLMGNVDAYGLPYTDASVLEFCDLSLYTSDYSAQYTGVAQAGVCSMSAIDLASCQLWNGQNPDDGNPTDGQNAIIGSSWDGITNRTGFRAHMSGLTNFTDGKTFENNYFNLLKSYFRYIDYPESEPIIPVYIVIFFCGIILFRFLSH